MDKLQYVYVSDMRPVIRSQWGYQGTAYGCMNCGFGVIAPIYNYCPNCGAVMSDEVTGKTAPVNVVRCRYCRWRVTGKPDLDCEICAGRLDWFCADGERRDDDAGDRR